MVLYFYPKDDTPGCTRAGLRDPRRLGRVRAGTARRCSGVSPDSTESHVKFRDKFSLPFPLLADPDHAIAEAYGAWGEKKNYGKTYDGHRSGRRS